MAWIKLETSFYRHPKTAELLAQPKGADLVVALQRIWLWAGESESPQARQGHVSDAVLQMLGVNAKQAQQLGEVGFLHRNGNGWHIHDWDDHQGALLDRRTKDRERKRKERADD